MVKNLLASAGDTGDVALISQLGRSAGVGNGKPYSTFLSGKSHGQGALGLHGVAWGGPRGCGVGQDLAAEHARAELHEPGRAESRNAEPEVRRNRGYGA